MARMQEYRPPDRSGRDVTDIGVQDGDYFFEYGVGYSPLVYYVRSGRLALLPTTVARDVAEGKIGQAIGKHATAEGAISGVVFEIEPRKKFEARQVGNVEGSRRGAKVVWMPAKNQERRPNMHQTKMPFMRGKIDADLKKRYEFFKTFEGGGRVGHAAEDSLLLARAERIAEEQGWEAEWDQDLDPDYGDVDPDDVKEMLDCVLKDANGKVLEVLGGNMFGHDSAENRNYRRFVEAELALQAAQEKDLL